MVGVIVPEVHPSFPKSWLRIVFVESGIELISHMGKDSRHGGISVIEKEERN